MRPVAGGTQPRNCGLCQHQEYNVPTEQRTGFTTGKPCPSNALKAQWL